MERSLCPTWQRTRFKSKSNWVTMLYNRRKMFWGKKIKSFLIFQSLTKKIPCTSNTCLYQRITQPLLVLLWKFCTYRQLKDSASVESREKKSQTGLNKNVFTVHLNERFTLKSDFRDGFLQDSNDNSSFLCFPYSDSLLGSPCGVFCIFRLL